MSHENSNLGGRVKIGLVARGEDRGLGILTWEFYRHIEPDRTLLVDMGPLARGFDVHHDRYPDALTVTFDGHRFDDEALVRSWLDELDVLYSAETFYDWRIVQWAREQGVATVLHVMPEFFRHYSEPTLIRPDVFWTPTSWRLEMLDPNTVVVPVPVALDRFAVRQRREGRVFLHVAGHRAAGDRAGTTSLLRALRYVSEPMHVVMITQDENLPITSTKRFVTLERRVRSTCDYWQLYDDGDVFVSPRRYGGLSLPHNEAAGAGLALVLADVPPNRETWPGSYVQAERGDSFDTQGGPVSIYATDPQRLAAALDELAASPTLVQDLSASSICWAQTHSWEALRGLYLTEFAEAIERTRVAAD